MARIYANENFPLPVVEELRRLGHDILTVLEAGKAGLVETDEAVLPSIASTLSGCTASMEIILASSSAPSTLTSLAKQTATRCHQSGWRSSRQTSTREPAVLLHAPPGFLHA